MYYVNKQTGYVLKDSETAKGYLDIFRPETVLNSDRRKVWKTTSTHAQLHSDTPSQIDFMISRAKEKIHALGEQAK